MVRKILTRTGGGVRRPDRQHRGAAGPAAERLHRRHVRAADRHRHPGRAGEARPRPAARVHHRRPSPTAWRRSPTCGSGWCWRASSPTWPRSAPSSTSGCIRTGWCTCRRCPARSSATRGEVVTSGQVVKVKVMEVDEAAQADLAHPAAGRRTGRGRGPAVGSAAGSASAGSAPAGSAPAGW